MPIQQDFQASYWSENNVTLALNPPAPVSGLAITFSCTRRAGGDDVVLLKSCASGFNGVSGITVTNGQQGVMDIRINPAADISGTAVGNYVWQARIVTSGLAVTLGDGYLSVNP